MIDHYFTKAQSLYRRGDTQAAVDLLLKLIGSFPDAPEGYLTLSDVMRDLGQPAGALEALEQMPEAARDVRFDVSMALALADTDQQDCAAAASERLMSVPSATAVGLLVKGQLAARADKTAEAIGLLQLAIDRDPACGEAMTCLGRLLWRTGDTVGALDFLARGLEATPWRTDAATAYHEAVTAVGAYDHAQPVFSRIFDADPAIERTTCLYIDVLLKRGELARAMTVVKTALSVLGASDALLDGALSIQRQLKTTQLPGRIPQITLCMIVKDEQAQLARCLHSVAPVVDEMVVVDTGSTDRTCEVARLFGARVVNVAWNADFAAARNAGLDQTTGQWILIMDADEALSARDHDALRQLVSRSETGMVAFALTTRNYIYQMNAMGWHPNDGRYRAEEAGNGWFPSEKVRLFPNLKAVRFCYPVHEVVEPALKQAGIGVRQCPVPVHHYGKLDLRQSSEKGAAYFQIGLGKVDQMAGDPLALRELAIQAMNLERFDDAVALWQRLADADPNRAENLVNLSSAHWHRGRYREARDCARRALALAPGLKEAAYNLANSLLHLGAAAEAADILAAAIGRHPDYLAGRFLLAAALCCAGRQETGIPALRSLGSSLLGPGLPLSCATLIESLAGAGQPDLARRLASGAAASGCGRTGEQTPPEGALPQKTAPALGALTL
ncbi:MAG: tetratricopeptide repeat protein [Pseudomonadota bacterium]